MLRYLHLLERIKLALEDEQNLCGALLLMTEHDLRFSSSRRYP